MRDSVQKMIQKDNLQNMSFQATFWQIVVPNNNLPKTLRNGNLRKTGRGQRANISSEEQFA